MEEQSIPIPVSVDEKHLDQCLAMLRRATEDKAEGPVELPAKIHELDRLRGIFARSHGGDTGVKFEMRWPSALGAGEVKLGIEITPLLLEVVSAIVPSAD